MVPLQFAAVFPRFLTNEPRIIEDKVHWPRITDMMRRDRKVYLDCIKSIASRRDATANAYFNVLDRADEIDRYWWLSAVNRLDIMRAISTKEERPV